MPSKAQSNLQFRDPSLFNLTLGLLPCFLPAPPRICPHPVFLLPRCSKSSPKVPEMDVFNPFHVLAALDEEDLDLEDDEFPAGLEEADEIHVLAESEEEAVDFEANVIHVLGEVDEEEVDLEADQIEALANLAVGVNGKVDRPAAVKKPWKIVQRRLTKKNGDKIPEPDVPTPPMPVCELEVFWEPKVGSLRKIREWAQERKTGCTFTPAGLANLIY